MSVLNYESCVDDTIPELLDALSRHKVVDMAEMLLFETMDSAMRVSFSESLGFLKSEADIEGTIQTISDRLNHWGWWSSIPELERLVYRNPIAMRVPRTPSGMAATAVRKLRARQAEGQQEKSRLDLLQKFIEASEEHPETIDMSGMVGMLMSTISGAGDTTATTMTAVIYNLLKNRGALSALRREIQDAELSELPSFDEVHKLPYLNAVIGESMRVYPTVTWPMERKVPSGGARIVGKSFPEGTSVGCMPLAVHFNPKAFGEDANLFRPERWFEADEETHRAMKAAHLGFSRGRRVCIGQNIAVMQMKKVVSALVLKFEMKLVDPDAILEADYSPGVVCLKPLYVQVEERDQSL